MSKNLTIKRQYINRNSRFHVLHKKRAFLTKRKHREVRDGKAQEFREKYLISFIANQFYSKSPNLLKN